MSLRAIVRPPAMNRTDSPSGDQSAANFPSARPSSAMRRSGPVVWDFSYRSTRPSRSALKMSRRLSGAQTGAELVGRAPRETFANTALDVEGPDIARAEYRIRPARCRPGSVGREHDIHPVGLFTKTTDLGAAPIEPLHLRTHGGRRLGRRARRWTHCTAPPMPPPEALVRTRSHDRHRRALERKPGGVERLREESSASDEEQAAVGIRRLRRVRDQQLRERWLSESPDVDAGRRRRAPLQAADRGIEKVVAIREKRGLRVLHVSRGGVERRGGCGIPRRTNSIPGEGARCRPA